LLDRRSIEPALKHHLDRGKSILLLGPRQTGKTTLIAGMAPDLGLSLVAPRARQ
jgi:predicted AAA+ superfamily ATPase